jgi:hypothetical protein
MNLKSVHLELAFFAICRIRLYRQSITLYELSRQRSADGVCPGAPAGHPWAGGNAEAFSMMPDRVDCALPLRLPSLSATDANLCARLERGELLYVPTCPFPLPHGEDRVFLFGQRQSAAHKNIALDPEAGRLSGIRSLPPEEQERLRRLLQGFGMHATDWLGRLLPVYASGWRRDRITFRPEEEATRSLRHSARNDLLHIDTFPTRPTYGARILRLFVNIHAQDPRVWVTSETFPRLLDRYCRTVGLPRPVEGTWRRQLGRRLLQALGRRTADCFFDQFMLRLHHFLKADDNFQEKCPKRYWKFPPGALWLVFADGVSHAVLRGRYALEHSYFIPLSCLTVPDEAPIALLDKARGTAVVPRAA